MQCNIDSPHNWCALVRHSDAERIGDVENDVGRYPKMMMEKGSLWSWVIIGVVEELGMVSMRSTIVTKHAFKMMTEEIEGE